MALSQQPRLPTPGTPRQLRPRSLPAAPRLHLTPQRTDPLATIQLREEDLLEPRLLPDALMGTIRLGEDDLMQLGLVIDNPLPPAAAAIDRELLRMVRPVRGRIAAACVLALAVALGLALLLGGTGPVVGFDLRPQPGITGPTSAAVSVVPVRASFPPSSVPAPRIEAPAEALPVVSMTSVSVEPAPAPVAHVAKSRHRPRRARRQRAVNPDALLATARRSVDPDALLASARSHGRLLRRTVDPFQE